MMFTKIFLKFLDMGHSGSTNITHRTLVDWLTLLLWLDCMNDFDNVADFLVAYLLVTIDGKK